METQGDSRRPAGHLEACGLLMMAIAWGWVGGNFSQPDFAIGTQILITIAHYVPCAIILVLGLRLLVGKPSGSIRMGVTGMALLSSVALAIIIVLGASNSDPNSFGPHNFADYVPVVLLSVGILTWYASQLFGSRVQR